MSLYKRITGSDSGDQSHVWYNECLKRKENIP
jgi:hypothetical protein